MRSLFVIFFLVLTLVACDSRSASESRNPPVETKDTLPFDSAKWRIREGKDYPYREAMLEDLMESQRLKSLNYETLIELLGPPDRTDSLYLFYLIDQTRIQGWPLHTKTMVIKLSDDSTVFWVKVHK